MVEQAAKGEPFIIAKAGKPMVKVIALNAPEPSQIKRFGLMAGQIEVPDDFDRMGEKEIMQIFEEMRETAAGHPPATARDLLNRFRHLPGYPA